MFTLVVAIAVVVVAGIVVVERVVASLVWDKSSGRISNPEMKGLPTAWTRPMLTAPPVTLTLKLSSMGVMKPP
jgi:hypothetical protein